MREHGARAFPEESYRLVAPKFHIPTVGTIVALISR